METLQDSDSQAFDMECIRLDSGLRYELLVCTFLWKQMFNVSCIFLCSVLVTYYGNWTMFRIIEDVLNFVPAMFLSWKIKTRIYHCLWRWKLVSLRGELLKIYLNWIGWLTTILTTTATRRQKWRSYLVAVSCLLHADIEDNVMVWACNLKI